MTMQAENQPQAARQSAVREMSDEELRVKVAELRGESPNGFVWEFRYWVGNELTCLSPGYETQEEANRECQRFVCEGYECSGLRGRPKRLSDLANYPLDLNAMAEAEESLNMSQLSDYINLIDKYPQHGRFATARQRAETFVLTLAPSLPAAVQPPNED